MSKKNNAPAVDGSPVSTEQPQQPAFVQELLEYGTITIMAKSRDALAELVNDIHADCSYMAGAVGYNPETGLFSLRLDIINN